MHKKWLLACVLLGASPVIAQAEGNPYVGFGLGIQNADGYNGLIGTLSGGYSYIGGLYQNYYIAAEIFGDSGGLALSHKHPRRTNYGIGASILPGIILRETVLAYARIGVENFRYSSSPSSVNSVQVGFGLQTSINEKWDIRGEYVYSGQGYHNYHLTQYNFFKLGLVYKFI